MKVETTAVVIDTKIKKSKRAMGRIHDDLFFSGM